jgi:hypothetical protein
MTPAMKSVRCLCAMLLRDAICIYVPVGGCICMSSVIGMCCPGDIVISIGLYRSYPAAPSVALHGGLPGQIGV